MYILLLKINCWVKIRKIYMNILRKIKKRCKSCQEERKGRGGPKELKEKGEGDKLNFNFFPFYFLF